MLAEKWMLGCASYDKMTIVDTHMISSVYNELS